MASVRVAVRVRPRNEREANLGSQFIIEMQGKQTRLTNLKIAARGDTGDHGRERLKTFTYDFSYWSVEKVDPKYASQEQIFRDLGQDVIQSAYEGYNACVFAYGQTSSGKTYTMMGNPDDVGLIPRICKGLFSRMSHETMTYRTEVSYLEIYNEKVRDLLKFNKGNTSLRVREHPSKGPYVQDLSVHTVMNFDDINELIAKGNSYRTTASTNMNDVSSRSHAIFTILFTQAKFSQDTPSETHSKLHLVDLAGSERADATGATGQRLKEGGSINKSLVTLGNVISTLADLSDKAPTKGNIFIPYRDSVLTWLLKDSLGGNSKTIMIATVSPAACNYAETLSTLRYANRAKNIINKPTVNEDPNVKLIRELRNEIDRLRALLGGKMDKMITPKVQEKLHENVARVKVLTEEWQSKWKEVADILQQEKALAIKKEGMGVVLHSELPHLLGIEDDMLSTGIVLYHLKEGRTTIGTAAVAEKQDIVLSGPELQPEHCVIDHRDGEVTLTPSDNATCTINGKLVTESTKLTQAAVILMGNTNVFRFNHPAEAAKLRQEYKGSDMNLSRGSLLSQSMSDLYKSSDNLAAGWEMELKHQEQIEVLEAKRHEIKEMEDSFFKLEAERLGLLETRKRQLDDMEQEAELKRDEAEKAQKKVQRDALKLKRKSQDLERQLAALAQTQQDMKNQAQVDEEEEQKPLEEKKRNFHKVIAEERENLSALEKQLEEEADDRSRDLNQGLEEAQTRKKKDTDKWEEEKIRLQGDAKAIGEGLRQTETEIKKKTEILASVKNQELEEIKMETEHLGILRQDFRKYANTAPQLSSSVQNNLSDEYEKLMQEQTKIKDKERSVYEMYKQDEEELLEREERAEAEIRDEWKKIEADQVYLAECEDCFRQACETGQFKNEADKEKDRAAIEAEKWKIREEENEFEQKEKENRKVFAEEKKQLFDTRCKQVERLNKDKEKIKEMNSEWQALVDYSVSDREEKAATIVEQIVQDKKDLKILEHSLEVQKKKQKECGIELENTQQVVTEISSTLQEELSDLATIFDKKQQLTQLDLQRDMQKITKRQNFLSALEDEQTDSETEADIVLQRKRKAFHRYKEITQVDMENEAQKLDELQASFSSLKHEVRFSKPEASSGENTQLMKKIEDVKAFEEELKATEDQYEEERQQALDNIDYEKLKLRELEEQQRINTRVEQAVKRLLFEQRVVRDKQRRIERDKNQQAREHERAQIEKAHQRELQRMREKYEANGHVSDNTPTRANPYASVMSGDAAPVSVSQSPTRQKSPELSPSRGSLYGAKQIELIIATYDKRGSTFSPYFQYEVKITVAGETWSICRRYSEIRDLHNQLKVKYPEVSALHFPPKRILGNILEKIATERRGLLEDYLRNMLEVLQRNPKSPLHPKQALVYSKSLLCKFHPFFKRGVFENSRHGTG